MFIVLDYEDFCLEFEFFVVTMSQHYFTAKYFSYFSDKIFDICVI